FERRVGRRHHLADQWRILERPRNVRQVRVVDVMVVVNATDVETANIAAGHWHCRVEAEANHDAREQQQSRTRSNSSPVSAFAFTLRRPPDHITSVPAVRPLCKMPEALTETTGAAPALGYAIRYGGLRRPGGRTMSTVEESIDVLVPVRTAYNQW